MNISKQNGLFTALLIFLLFTAGLPPVAAASMDRVELSDSIISYMKAEYLDENVVHLSRDELQVETRAHLGINPLPEDNTVLKIATTNAVKSESFYGDYYIGIFSHLSNMPLMQMDSKGKLFGQSARSYGVSADNTEWTFYLKDELYWSDGRKVTPEDVEFSFTYLAENIASAGWIKDTLDDTSVSEEDNSVTFSFNQPYTNINLEFATYNIVPKHVWENIKDPEEYTSRGPYVGYGPYFLEDINLASRVLTFRKNPHWKGKVPNFGRVEIHLYDNEDVASLALEKGEADTYYKYAKSYPYANIESLKNTGNFNTIENTGIGVTFLGMNLKKEGPLSDSAFREAIAYAIDYEDIKNIETLGYGKVPNRGFVPSGMDYFKDTDKLGRNVAKAREILEELGYTDVDKDGIYEGVDGNELSLILLIRGGYESTGSLMEEYLEAAGIGVEIEQVDTASWFDRKDNYDYDLTISGTTPWGMLMHAGWGTGYLDERRTGKGVMHILGDQEFLDLCDGILATTDSDKLEEYVFELQDYYARELPIIPLYWKGYVVPYNKEFTGWHYNPLFGIYNLDTFLEVRRV